jgi:hypothetical protein
MWPERGEMPVVGCGKMVVRRVGCGGLGIVSESDRSDIGRMSMPVTGDLTDLFYICTESTDTNHNNLSVIT